jgi:hypothetical protein
MSQYAKTIAAAIGMLAYLSKDFFGIEIPQETVDKIVEGILALGTVWAVYRVSNS